MDFINRAGGFNLGPIELAWETYRLSAPRVWGFERPDAQSVAFDCGLISVMLSSRQSPRWDKALKMVGLVLALVGAGSLAALAQDSISETVMGWLPTSGPQ